MRERILAIVGAVVLIAVAVFVRGQFIDSNGNGGGKGKRARASGGSAERPVVACTPDLAAICQALVDTGEIADSTPTLDLDRAGDPAVVKDTDGWITWSLAPRIANFIHDRTGTSGPWNAEGVRTLGGSYLGIFPSAEAVGLLGADCPQATWSCIAGVDIDQASIAVGDPTTSEGLTRVAPLALALAKDGDPTNLDEGRLRAIVASPQIAPTSAAYLAPAPDQVQAQAVQGGGAIGIVISPDRLTQTGTRPAAVTPRSAMVVVFSARAGTESKWMPSCDREELASALQAVGVTPCAKADTNPDLAGFLFQVRKALK